MSAVVRVEGEEDEVRVDDLDVGRLGDVGGGDRAGAALHELQRDRVTRERAKAELLHVQDDLGHVFLDVVDRAELVEDAGDLDAGHGRALERAEQDAAQRVAERDAVAVLERLHLERAAVAIGLDLVDARARDRQRGGGWGGFEINHQRFVHFLWASASSTRRRAAR